MVFGVVRAEGQARLVVGAIGVAARLTAGHQRATRLTQKRGLSGHPDPEPQIGGLFVGQGDVLSPHLQADRVAVTREKVGRLAVVHLTGVIGLTLRGAEVEATLRADGAPLLGRHLDGVEDVGITDGEARHLGVIEVLGHVGDLVFTL